MQLSYPGYEQDIQEAEEAHTGTSTFVKFDQKIWEMEEKQRMFENDRSHPRLRHLDALHLTYPGYEQDVKVAEEQHVNSRSYNFSRKIEGMKRSQSMHEGDRTHPNLLILDNLQLSYPGADNDKKEAEEAHRCLTFQSFEDKLIEMKLRQQIHDNDRSHARLKALDNLKLCYPGYEQDMEVALEQHVCNRAFNFQAKLDGMKEKQKMYNGDRTHPNLALLDSLQVSYPGWQQDVKEAEAAHTGSIWTKFEDMIFQIKEQQKIYVGDRSHERLIQLDSLQLSYPGWKDDVNLAVRDHIHSWKASFEKRLMGMQEKERIYCGYSLERTPFDQEQLQSIGECIICSQRPKTHALFPCGHLCLCHYCAKLDSFKKCPICRQDSTSRLHVFAPYISSVHIGACVLCAENPKTHAFVPCGHMAICSTCADKPIKHCPVCKNRSSHIIKLYI